MAETFIPLGADDLARWNGKKVPLDEDGERRIVAHFSQLIQTALDQRTERDKLYQQEIKLYEGIPAPRVKPWNDAAETTVGFGAQLTDTTAQALATAITRVKPMFNCRAIDDEAEESEQKLERWINSYFIKDVGPIDGFKLVDNLCRRVSLDGTNTLIVPFEKFKKRELAVEKGKPGMRVVTHRQVQPIVLEYEQVITPTNARDEIPKLPWLAYQTEYNPDALLDFALEHRYENIEKIFTDAEPVGEKTPPKGGGKGPAEIVVPGLSNATENKINQARLESAGKTQDQEKVFNVVVVFGLWRFAEGQPREWIKLIYNHSNKQFMECNYLPMFYDGIPAERFIIHPMSGKYDGHSIMRLVADINFEVDGMVCRTSDNIDISLNKVTTHVPGGSFNPDVHKIFPGASFPQESKGEIDVLDIGGINFSAYPMIDKLMSYGYMRVGISASASTGQTDSSDPRASGKKAELLLGQSSRTLDFMTKYLNESLVAVVRRIIRYHAIADEPEIAFRTWDEDKKKYVTETITREELMRKYEITVNALSLSVNSKDELEKEMFIQEIFAKHPITSMPAKSTPQRPGLDQFSPSQVKALWYGLRAMLQKANVQNIEARMPLLKEVMPPEPLPLPEGQPPQMPPGMADMLKAAGLNAEVPGPQPAGALPPPGAPPVAPMVPQPA